MTVTSGVVTVTGGTVGVVTVTVAIGVLTVTTAGTVSADTETVGTGSVDGDSVDVTASTVDERTKACAATPVEACVDAGGALTPEPALPVLKGRRSDSGASAWRTVRLAPAGLPEWARGAAEASALKGAPARTV